MDAAVEAAIVSHFVSCVRSGDEATALSLLSAGHVSHKSRSPFGSSTTAPIVCTAIVCDRVTVARALLRKGASVADFHDLDDGSSITLAGLAIATDNVSMLGLCRRFGADLAHVCHVVSEGPHSAVEYAVMNGKLNCLWYLLDEVYTARPVCLSYLAMVYVCLHAEKGRDAMELYRQLVSRGFDFKVMDTKDGSLYRWEEAVGPDRRLAFTGYQNSEQESLVDILLISAQTSGDIRLMQYITKNLGLGANLNVGKMKKKKRFSDPFRSQSDLNGPRRNTAVENAECASCGTERTVELCSGCAMFAYCGRECMRKHWKQGGHKKLCKELKKRGAQRPASTAWSSSAGSSNAGLSTDWSSRSSGSSR